MVAPCSQLLPRLTNRREKTMTEKKRMQKNVKGVADQIDVDRNPQDDTCLGRGLWNEGQLLRHISKRRCVFVCQAPPK